MDDDLRDLIGSRPDPASGGRPADPSAAPLDYLPPRDPRDNPPAPPTSPVRTLVIWIMLIAGGVAVYTIFDSRPGAAAPWRHNAIAVAKVLWPFVLIGLFRMWFTRQLRGSTHLAEQLEPGTASLAAGEVERAIEQHRGVLARYARQPALAASAQFHLAVALLRHGALAEATEGLVALERTPGLLFGSAHRNLAASYLAWVFALRGDLDRADQWLADSDRRLRRARDGSERGYAAAIRALAAVTLAARRGDLDGAARTFDAAAPQLESTLSVTTMKAGWLIRAFVAARWDGPRAASAAEPWLRLIRSARPDEVDFVATAWPELQAFVASTR